MLFILRSLLRYGGSAVRSRFSALCTFCVWYRMQSRPMGEVLKKESTSVHLCRRIGWPWLHVKNLTDFLESLSLFLQSRLFIWCLADCDLDFLSTQGERHCPCESGCWRLMAATPGFIKRIWFSWYPDDSRFAISHQAHSVLVPGLVQCTGAMHCRYQCVQPACIVWVLRCCVHSVWRCVSQWEYRLLEQSCNSILQRRHRCCHNGWVVEFISNLCHSGGSGCWAVTWWWSVEHSLQSCQMASQKVTD